MVERGLRPRRKQIAYRRFATLPHRGIGSSRSERGFVRAELHMSEELVALATRLIGYDTSESEGVLEAAGFVKGWLEARGIEAAGEEVRGLPVLRAEVGPDDAPTVVLHGHLDVVPGRPGQFDPHLDGDRLYGRGAYDMKGALAAMLMTTAAMREQERVRVRLGIVGDEESEEEADRGSDHLVDSGFIGDFAIT